jgi:hypothetical protein
VPAVPADVGLAGMVLAVIGLPALLARGRAAVVLRLVLYASAFVVVYLMTSHPPPGLLPMRVLEAGYFAFLAAMVGLAMRLAPARTFPASPMDLLVALVMVLVGVLGSQGIVAPLASALLVKMVIIAYACEVLVARMPVPRVALVLPALAALGILSLKAFA